MCLLSGEERNSVSPLPRQVSQLKKFWLGFFVAYELDKTLRRVFVSGLRQSCSWRGLHLGLSICTMCEYSEPSRSILMIWYLKSVRLCYSTLHPALADPWCLLLRGSDGIGRVLGENVLLSASREWFPRWSFCCYEK